MLLAGVVPNLTAVIAEFVANAASPISTMLSGSSILTFLLNFLAKASLPILVAAKSVGNLIEVPVTVTAFTLARPLALNPVMVSPFTVKSAAVKAKVGAVSALTTTLRPVLLATSPASDEPSEEKDGVNSESELVATSAIASPQALCLVNNFPLINSPYLFDIHITCFIHIYKYESI